MNLFFIASTILILSYKSEAAPNLSHEDNGYHENQYEGDLIESQGTQNSKKGLQHERPVDCAEVFENGFVKSGVYEIFPKGREIGCNFLKVYCDMETDSGGWTVIQRRGNFKRPADYFYKTWNQYKEGFGNVRKDFWLGNDNIHALTYQKKYSVRFDLATHNETAYALYDDFVIGSEEFKYRLHITDYSGTAGNSMAYHHNKDFSTKDRKNDNNSVSCAEKHKGGWWYGSCRHANLNGPYGTVIEGIVWNHWKGYKVPLTSVEIKIRPNNF